jgi:NhaP-type Na+/H+ or K+/H+ antiporter
VALVLAFGVVLLISVSLSGVAARTVLSTALMFLVAGALIGQGGFGLVDIPSNGSFVTGLAGIGDWTVAVLAILLVRPAAMLLSLLRTPPPNRERAAAAWFGPKGFASVVYGLLALQAGIPAGEHVSDLVAVTIALSIVLHSSTDVPVARALRVEPPDNLPTGARQDDDRKPA